MLTLTTPQDLGEAPADLELRDEYEEMSQVLKEDFRESRKNILLKYSDCEEEKKQEAADIIAKNGRPVSQAGDDDLGRRKILKDHCPLCSTGVFVDETTCTRCYKCVEVASSTFGIHRKVHDIHETTV